MPVHPRRRYRCFSKPSQCALPQQPCVFLPLASRSRSQLIEMVRAKWSKNAQKGQAYMSTEENKRLIRQFFEGVNARDMTVFELFAPDAVHHNPFPGTPAGREGNKQGMLLLFAAFPDWHTTIEDLIAEGDKVVVRMTQRGTHQGTLFGIAATGKQ